MPESPLTWCIDYALATEPAERIPSTIQKSLAAALRHGRLLDLDRFRQTKPNGYARRLLHADPAGRYTVVVMTWGAGDSTPIHDHAGIWCVEGVVEGEIAVTQYRVEHGCSGELYFEPQMELNAGPGSTGALIPPHEYHKLANVTPQTAITVHIYGGEMAQCRAYFAQPDGSYATEIRTLCYDD